MNQKTTLQANTKSEKPYHNDIRLDQQEVGHAILLLGYHDINQVEIFTLSVTKMELLVAHNNINQVGMYT